MTDTATILAGLSGAGALTSAFSGAIGCLLAPASAVAAGGILNVMAACSIGAAITTIPAMVAWVPTIGLISFSYISGHKTLAAILGVVLATEIMGVVLLSAEIGAAVLGIASNPVFICSLIGSTALIAGTLLGFAIALFLGVSVVDDFIHSQFPS